MTDRSKKSAYIAKKIKALRESVNWSQAELARNAKVTSAAVSLIEKGDRIPSLEVCRKLAKALNVSTAEITGETSLSSEEINDEAQVFFRQYGDINELSEMDQKLLKAIIKRFRELAIEK
jgi:transcriptional regulator with XRE-family HTH domain